MGDFEWYEKDGKKYERVTRILDYFANPDLVKWKVKVGSKEAKRISMIAMKIGTNVDDWIKSDILGQKLPPLKTDDAKNCVEAYRKWKKDYAITNDKLRVGVTEYDDVNMAAGTPDIWTYENCIDIKCSASIRSNYWLQVNWYAMQKVSTQTKAILRLDKSLAIYEYEVRPVSIEELDIFNGLLKAYRYFKQQESLKEGEGEEDVTDAEPCFTEGKEDSAKAMDKTEVSDDRPGRNW